MSESGIFDVLLRQIVLTIFCRWDDQLDTLFSQKCKILATVGRLRTFEKVAIGFGRIALGFVIKCL